LINYLQRLFLGLIAGYLTFLSLQGANYMLRIMTTISVLLISCAGVAHYDYNNKERDCDKGNCFVLKNRKKFQVFVLFLWFLAIISSLVLFILNNIFGIIAFGLIAGMLVYPKIKTTPWLPNLFLAVLSIGFFLFPFYFFGITYPLFYLAIILFALILAREIVKDMELERTDEKWTIAQAIGEEFTLLLVAAIVLPCTVLFLNLGYSLNLIYFPLLIFILAIGLSIIMPNKKNQIIKSSIEALILFTVIIFKC